MLKRNWDLGLLIEGLLEGKKSCGFRVYVEEDGS